MAQTYGIEAPHGASATSAQPSARYLVLIDAASDGTRLALLYLDNFEKVAEFDAAGPEVQAIAGGLVPQQGADGHDWDTALAGHTRAERQAAQVYTLAV